MKARKKEEGNVFWNVIREEWAYLGDRKRIFAIYMAFFVIAGSLALTVPYIVGLIFNTIQESITSSADLKKLFFLISLLLVVDVVFWIFHGKDRKAFRRYAYIRSCRRKRG
jgi:ABC-type multidrug transport system fused ATPase/permease subunit